MTHGAIPQASEGRYPGAEVQPCWRPAEPWHAGRVTHRRPPLRTDPQATFALVVLLTLCTRWPHRSGSESRHLDRMAREGYFGKALTEAAGPRPSAEPSVFHSVDRGLRTPLSAHCLTRGCHAWGFSQYPSWHDVRLTRKSHSHRLGSGAYCKAHSSA